MRGGTRRRVLHHLLPWVSLAPALCLIVVLFGASVVYGVAQSLGYLPVIGQERLSLAAYRNLLAGSSVVAQEFWPALGFSLWVSTAATLIAAAGALLLAVGLHTSILVPRQRSRAASSRGGTRAPLLLHLNLAFPHLVWAVGLLLLLAQSGFLARIAAFAGVIAAPSDFPVLVRDSYGVGIILAYVSKGMPFLALIVLAVLRSQVEAYDMVAENLGANRWQRLRHVTLPLVLPGLSAGALLLFAFVFGAYEVPAILGVRFPRMLAVVALDFFLNPDLRSRAEGMAISVLMALVVLVIAAAVRRHIG
jgi:putative spermidine/putrescine transport system permease protein